MMQKQQVEIEIIETDRALEELKKIGTQDPVYKSAGPLLIKSQKEDLLKELGEKKRIIKYESDGSGKAGNTGEGQP